MSDNKNTLQSDIAPNIQETVNKLPDSETTIHSIDSLKNIVEATILAANKPISLDKILAIFPEKEAVNKHALRKVIDLLVVDYSSRGIELVEVSSGYRFQATKEVAPWVSRLWDEKPQKYSRALLETLALVAYRQPVTRGEIEEIRGVSVSSQIMRTLVEREWIRIIGHRDVPGKPAMYATTKTFLDYFGLTKLDDLPSLSEIRDLDIINAELDFGDAQNNDEQQIEDKEIAKESIDSSTAEPQNEEKEVIEDANSEDISVDISDALEALKKQE